MPKNIFIGGGGSFNHSYSTDGLESVVNYLQKDVHLGKKMALNLWYVDTRPNSQKLFLGI